MLYIHYFILLAALGYAAYSDTRKMEIPIPVFPICCVAVSAAKLLLNGIGSFGLFECVSGMIVMAIPFIIGAFIGVSGGGDILMFASVGFTIGIWQLPAFALSLAVCGTVLCGGIFVYSRMQNKKVSDFFKSRIPLAPIACISYILFLIVFSILNEKVLP